MGEFVFLGGKFVFFFHSDELKDLQLCFFFKSYVCLCLHPYQSYIQSSSKHWKPQQSIDQPNLLDLGGRLGFCLFWSACLPLRLFGATAPSGISISIDQENQRNLSQVPQNSPKQKKHEFGCHDSFFDMKKNVVNEKNTTSYPADSSFCPTWIGRKSTPGARPDFFQTAAGASVD